LYKALIKKMFRFTSN